MSLLGVSIGASSCAAVVYARDGSPLGHGFKHYAFRQPLAGEWELDVEKILSQIGEAIADAARRTTNNDPIVAMCLAEIGEVLVPVDAADRPLTPVLAPRDARAQGDIDWLVQELGGAHIQQITGLPPLALAPLVKMRWQMAQQPDLRECTTRYYSLGAMFLRQLGLDAVMDYSLAGRTLAMDLTRKQWSAELVDAIGLSITQLPRLAHAGTSLGILSDSIAARYALPSGVHVILGGHDQACAALGAGVLTEGVALDAVGAVESLVVPLARPIMNAAMLDNHYGCYPHVVPDRYLTLAYNYTAGTLLRWYCDIWGILGDDHPDRRCFAALAHGATLGPSPILVLPHFGAAGTPWLDERSVGAIVGLTLTTTREEIMKGMLDGLSYALRLNRDRLGEAGIPLPTLRVIGEGTHATPWLQSKADILQCPVEWVDVPDAITRGAALLAGWGAGIFTELPSACAAWLPEVVHIEPCAEDAARYEQQYRHYVQLYPALRGITSG